MAACKPMYGDPPAHLAKPGRVKPPKGWNQEPVVENHYLEDCTVDFRAAPTTKRQTKVAEQQVIAGDSALANVKPDAPDQTKAEMAVRSIEHYKEALLADPYNAEATLKLALAYDKVLRKGCAIAMLKRLDSLAANPKFNADPVVGRIVDNEQWFKPYRNEALKAIGH